MGIPPDAPRDLTSLDNYINDKLIRRLGVANANYVKLSKQMVNVVKKINKSGCKPTRKTFKIKKKKSKNKSKKKNPKVVESIQLEWTNNQIQILLIMIFLYQSLRIVLLALKVLLLN